MSFLRRQVTGIQPLSHVIPAQAGIQAFSRGSGKPVYQRFLSRYLWIPASAGMTGEGLWIPAGACTCIGRCRDDEGYRDDEGIALDFCPCYLLPLPQAQASQEFCLRSRHSCEALAGMTREGKS